jgi:hypothetical protein
MTRQGCVATLDQVPTTHEQLMFHRDWHWMIGLCFVLLPPIQGDRSVANLGRCDITSSSNRKEPLTLKC